MINSVVELFKVLFSSLLNFTDIINLLTVIALVTVVVTLFIYILRGRY